MDDHVISDGELTATIIEFGAVVRDLRLSGVDHPLVLGFEDEASYRNVSPHVGAIVGRCANRIAGGRFQIDGVTYQADRNVDGITTLHGGAGGFSHSKWRVTDLGSSYIALTLSHADGEQGFPGAIEALCLYSVNDGALRIDLSATTDAPTLCNLAQHAYFNLSDAASIDDHVLEVAAERCTPLGPDLTPTGDVARVSREFDFAAPRPIGAEAVDLNYVLADGRRERPAFAARLSAGRVEMTLETTEPGLQVYTGHMTPPGLRGLGGRMYGPRSGVCLEPQLWPDAPNQPGFPSAVLRPGETYRQSTILRFRALA